MENSSEMDNDNLFQSTRHPKSQQKKGVIKHPITPKSDVSKSNSDIGPSNAWLSLGTKHPTPKHVNVMNNRGVTSIPGTTFADKLKQCKTASSNRKANCSVENAGANNAVQCTAALTPSKEGLKSTPFAPKMPTHTGWIPVGYKHSPKVSSPEKNVTINDGENSNNDPQAGLNAKRVLTEDELEIMREKRRERRKREKENKKKVKEQQKRAEYYAPKSSKINVVSADTLLKSGIGISINTSSEQRNTCSKNSKSEINNKTGHAIQERNNQEISNPKTTRFLDDEYPTLHSGASRDRKNIPSKNYRSGKLSNFVENTNNCVNGGKLSYNSEDHTISENESASEWETEDEECLYTQRRFDTVQELRHLDAECDGLNSSTHLEFESKKHSLPKSILRRKCNDSEPKLPNSGLQIETSSISPPNQSWSNVVQFSDVKVSASKKCVPTMEMAKSNNTSTARNALQNSSYYELLPKAKMKESKVDDSTIVKKVKKKDPITLDLFQAIQLPKKTTKSEKRPVLGSKLSSSRLSSTPLLNAKKTQFQNTIKFQPVRNTLDSTAPTIKRGKEREKPKKKRPSKMRKIIAAERASRINFEKLNFHDDGTASLNSINKAALDNEPSCVSSLPDYKSSQRSSEDNVLGEIRLNDYDTRDKNLNKEISQKEEEVKIIEDVSESTKSDEMLNTQTDDTITNRNEDDTIYQAKQVIHTRKFRMHCHHVLSKELDKIALTLLQDLVRFQDKKFAEDPVKAKARRRYVVGLREATKYMKVSKVMCLIVAPDVENIESKGGLNDMIGSLITMAAHTGEYGEKKPVPVFFVMNRWALGKAIYRKVAISCVAVLNYQGSDENFKAMLELLPSLKQTYRDKLNDAMQKINQNLTSTNVVVEDIHILESNNCKGPDKSTGDTSKCDIKDNIPSIKCNETRVINERMLQILQK